MIIYCESCNKTEPIYEVKRSIKSYDADTKKFGFLSVEWEEDCAICKDCGNEIYVPIVEKSNNINFKKATKEAQIKALGGDESKWREIVIEAERY